MIKAITKFKEEIERKLPRRAVLLLPGEFFFTRTLELPPGIDPKDLTQFAEFSLEGRSPFPLEQLAWGFLHKAGAPRLLLYAAHLETLRRRGFGGFEECLHVFPAFIIASNRKGEEGDGLLFIAFGASLSAVRFEDGIEIPAEIRSLSMEGEELAPEVLAAARQSLLDSFEGEAEGAEAETRFLSDPKLETDGSLCFRQRTLKPPEEEAVEKTESLSLRGDGLWNADVRNKAFIRKERKARNLSKKIWLSALAAGFAAVLFLFLQIGFHGMGIWIKSREKMIAAQSARVDEIEENFKLQQKIEQFAQQELRPFDMLEVANLNRPRSVYFTKAYAETYNRLRIEGLGNNVESVNRYTDILKKSPRIAKVETRVASRRGKAPFTLTLTFKETNLETENVVAAAGNLNPTAADPN